VTKGLTSGDYKSLGEEVLDGIPTAVYEMHSKFDTDEAGMKVKTTRIYEYDPTIRIEAPIP